MELRDIRRLSGVRITPYDIVGGSPGEHLGLPSASATLVIDLADGLVCSRPDRPEPDVFRCCIAGMHRRPVTIHHDGSQHGVQLALSPTAVRTLLSMPVAELTETSVELEQVDAALAHRLYEELAVTAPAARRAVCAAILADAVDNSLVSDSTRGSDAQIAWDLISRRRGQIAVTELVELSGWSARHLTGMFAAEFGLTPKQVARLHRFDAARAALESGRTAAEVADVCGYADQSHMTREFTEFTGYSPLRLLQRRATEFASSPAWL